MIKTGYLNAIVKANPTTSKFLVGFNGSANTLYNGTTDYHSHMKCFDTTPGKNMHLPALVAGGHKWNMRSVKNKLLGVTLFLVVKHS